MHGNIQRKFKELVDHHACVFNPGRLQEVLEQMVSTKPYIVTELTHNDTSDFESLADKLLRRHSLDGISQVRAVKFEMVSYMYKYQESELQCCDTYLENQQ